MQTSKYSTFFLIRKLITIGSSLVARNITSRASLLLILMSSHCAPIVYDLNTTACTGNESGEYSQSSAIKEVMNRLVDKVPGAAIAVWSKEGSWEYAAGFAKVENKTPMMTCNLQYLQSISKTYTSVCILKLAERGIIDLKAPITTYLLPKHSDCIKRAREITVEMILNHTSGIPEYNGAPRYITRLLQDPGHPFVPEDYLTYICGKAPDFEPGSRYSYRNTNYLIAALILDKVTGDHGTFMQKEIFDPLHLQHTYYYKSDGYLDHSTLVNSYWDRYSNGNIENVSVLQRNNVRAMIGDDGIVSTPADAVLFLKGLMEGKLITEESLRQMKHWVNDAKGNPTYGLGLDRTLLDSTESYGHSGGGLGAGCQLYYLPTKDIYYFISINLGTVTESPLHKEVEVALQKIAVIFNEEKIP
ncbi:serine hydrolase domain-containing protein [Chryseolinea sp. T2]|uniref:serine hydrolase domain-containing protein n=1 Tax=Chryseolinea sp. T2 TaxID=3129255 RepID=UPI0030772ED0